MPRIEHLLFSVRRIPLSGAGTPTTRQVEAVEQLGLGIPPADMTFAEASAVLTARNTAREVLRQIDRLSYIPRLIRLQLEPHLMQFLMRDARIMRELIQRNEKRWGFLKDGAPPPTPEIQNKILNEARRLVSGVPYATDRAIRLSLRNSATAWKNTTPYSHSVTGRAYPRKRRRRHSRPGILSGLFAIIRLTRLLRFSGTLIKGRASIIDGDTIEIDGQRIRIWGIDAPEDGQLCLKDGWPWHCAQDCRQALADFLGTQTVTCVEHGRDEFDRVLATCEVGGTDVGAWLVKSGWALDYKPYSKGHYTREQAEAKKARRGLWQGEFELPAKWRARSRWLTENNALSLKECRP